MTIDISKLSAKDLFELAMRKEQEEQQQAQRHGQLAELQKQRSLLIAAHEVAIAEIERKIGELTSQRSKLIADQEKSMLAVGREIAELMRKIQESEPPKAAPQPAAAPKAAAPVRTPPPPAPQPPAAPPPPPAPPASVTPPAPVTAQVDERPLVLDNDVAEAAESDAFLIDSKEDLFEKIREMMRTRSFISHSLLKEQLKVKGYNVPNLTKLVDQLIREGKLASAGGGNYALGKKA